MLKAIFYAIFGKREPHPQTELAAESFAKEVLHYIDLAQRERRTTAHIGCYGDIPIGHYNPDLPFNADPIDVIRSTMKRLPRKYRYRISDGRWLGFSVILIIKDIPLD